MALYAHDDGSIDLGLLDQTSFDPLDHGNVGKAHEIRLAYGDECAIAVSMRRPGHHSTPHTHDSEQLNYICEGEMWFFIGDRGYQMRKGDFLRVPRNTVHWSWVKSSTPCLAFECFSPPPARAIARGSGQALFEEGEDPNVRDSRVSVTIDLASLGLDQAAIEAQPPVNRP